MEKRNYYEVLGVDKSATKIDLKIAYRRLALKYHPGISKESRAGERFEEITYAYAILNDDEKRKIYDNHGHEGMYQFSREDLYKNINFEEILKDITKGIDEIAGRINYIFKEFGFNSNYESNVNNLKSCPKCSSPISSNTNFCNNCGNKISQNKESFNGNTTLKEVKCPHCKAHVPIISNMCIECGKPLNITLINI